MSDFCFDYTRKTGIDEGKYGFYRVIRSQIFRVLVTLFGKMASLSYNKNKYSNNPDDLKDHQSRVGFTAITTKNINC